MNNEINTASMTDEQINIAIAEACGWRCCKRDMQIAEFVHSHPYHGLVGIEPKSKEYDGTKDWQYWVIPNYVADLNAMHEAEKTMTWEQVKEYTLQLPNVAGFSYCEADTHEETEQDLRCYLAFATARHRAEVFLQTIKTK